MAMSGNDDPGLDEAQRLETLDRDECIELLAHHRFVGRLAVVVDGRPLIFPVNYIVDHDSVVFCTAERHETQRGRQRRRRGLRGRRQCAAASFGLECAGPGLRGGHHRSGGLGTAAAWTIAPLGQGRPGELGPDQPRRDLRSQDPQDLSEPRVGTSWQVDDGC